MRFIVSLVLLSVYQAVFGVPLLDNTVQLSLSRVSSSLIPSVKNRLAIAVSKANSQKLPVLHENLNAVAGKLASLQFTLGNPNLCMSLLKYTALEQELLSLSKLLDQVYEGLALANQEQPVAFNRVIMSELLIQNAWTYFHFNAFLCPEKSTEATSALKAPLRRTNSEKHVRFAELA